MKRRVNCAESYALASTIDGRVLRQKKCKTGIIQSQKLGHLNSYNNQYLAWKTFPIPFFVEIIQSITCLGNVTKRTLHKLGREVIPHQLIRLLDLDLPPPNWNLGFFWHWMPNVPHTQIQNFMIIFIKR